MIRVHIIGAAGYAAGELIRLLDGHPEFELGALESASAAGAPVWEVFRELADCSLTFADTGAVHAALAEGDIVVLAGGAERSRELASALLDHGVRVIDLSDAFRVGTSEAVYGLPERYADALRTARLVANPGCYPTATLLSLLPFAPLAAEVTQIIIDAKSGITGAGRNPALGSMFAEVDGDVRIYGVPKHRHAHEIGNELRALGIEAQFAFTPHVVPISRGMLADVYVMLRGAHSDAEVRGLFERFYAGSPFVSILEDGRVPYLPAVVRTNNAQIAISVRDGVIHVACGIDNLGKGAASQAVQSLNIMCGFSQEIGLGHRVAVTR